MTCDDYKALSALPFQELFQSEKYEAWCEHIHACRACDVWKREGELKKKGIESPIFPVFILQSTRRSRANNMPICVNAPMR